LKKISTLGFLFDSEQKKKMREAKLGKRFSVDREIECEQKQRIGTKSRVGTRRGENGRKGK
jgi:hypothetical protein